MLLWRLGLKYSHWESKYGSPTSRAAMYLQDPDPWEIPNCTTPPPKKKKKKKKQKQGLGFRVRALLLGHFLEPSRGSTFRSSQESGEGVPTNY